MVNSEFSEELNKQLTEDIRYEIARAGDQYADNFRAYRYKDNFGRKEFNSKANKGCCGSSQSHTIIDGEKYIIGWNHGH